MLDTESSLRERLAALTAQFQELAQRLLETAAALERGSLPATDLSTQLTHLEQEFQSLAQLSLSAAGSLPQDQQPANSPVTLPDIAGLIDCIEAQAHEAAA